MNFKIGRCYKHSVSLEMKIIGGVHSVLYGWTLIAETNNLDERFQAVGSDEDSAVNWIEITEETFMRNFS